MVFWKWQFPSQPSARKITIYLFVLHSSMGEIDHRWQNQNSTHVNSCNDLKWIPWFGEIVFWSCLLMARAILITWYGVNGKLKSKVLQLDCHWNFGMKYAYFVPWNHMQSQLTILTLHSPLLDPFPDVGITLAPINLVQKIISLNQGIDFRS